jgi:hypothetical protein
MSGLLRAAPPLALVSLLVVVGVVASEHQRQHQNQHEQGWDAFKEEFAQAEVPGKQQFSGREHPPVKINMVKVPPLRPIIGLVLP